MPYAILRFKKLKSGGVSACYAHNERKKEKYQSNPDIDSTRKSDNYHLVLPKQTYRREAKRLISAAGCKVRPNHKNDSGKPMKCELKSNRKQDLEDFVIEKTLELRHCPRQT